MKVSELRRANSPIDVLYFVYCVCDPKTVWLLWSTFLHKVLFSIYVFKADILQVRCSV